MFSQGKLNSGWLYIHVDDIAIFGRSVDYFKKEMASEFEIKDIGPADLILGVKVSQTKDSIWLDQKHFSKLLFDLYGMGECQPVSTPLFPHLQLSPETEDEVKEFKNLKISYQSAVCTINYLNSATRPDLSFAVSSLSQYIERPMIFQWNGFLHVLRYLQGSLAIGCLYSQTRNPGITSNRNANLGNCLQTRRFIQVFLASFNGFLFLWKTKKQPTVSLSTAEAKYKSLCNLTSELMWLHQ
ncbi:hypothetical protein O181_058692 [Austropuccinia psidii MF-1]|uniref:Reverse transcriptase Ty1/copia-type domain-containing protein n=1 Tax=Austropuccinia psidii MF-1 TaxID=1389203 RepID=A0A9Q3EF70_9BASI|nr:hypothetical protein [Austropuccinia psidii MF-1]